MDMIPTNPADKVERPRKEAFQAGFYGFRLGEAVAVVDHVLQRHHHAVYDTCAFGQQLVQQVLILLFGRDAVRARNLDDALIYPLSVVAAELGQTVHAEPHHAAEGVFEAVLSLEFCEDAVAAGAFLEGLQFRHRHKAHVRAADEAFAVDAAGAEPGFDFRKVDADEVSLAQQIFHQRFQYGFSAVTGAVHEQRFLHAPVLDVGQAHAGELLQQSDMLLVAPGERLHVAVIYRRFAGRGRPFARQLDRGKLIRRVRKQRHVGQPQQTILEVDDVLIAVQIFFRYEEVVGQQQVVHLVQRPRFYKVFIVIDDELLDHAQHHRAGHKPVRTVTIDIAACAVHRVILHEEVSQVIADVLRQPCRTDSV